MENVVTPKPIQNVYLKIRHLNLRIFLKKNYYNYYILMIVYAYISPFLYQTVYKLVNITNTPFSHSLKSKKF